MQWPWPSSTSSSLGPCWYSSSKSPMISAMTSPMVTRPEVPPCSSTARAILVRPSRRVRSSLATVMPSGTATIGRMRTSAMVASSGRS